MGLCTGGAVGAPMATEIPACLACASKDLRMPGLREGVVTGLTGGLHQAVCRRCGWKGIPVSFDDEGAYQEFRDSVRDGS